MNLILVATLLKLSNHWRQQHLWIRLKLTIHHWLNYIRFRTCTWEHLHMLVVWSRQSLFHWSHQNKRSSIALPLCRYLANCQWMYSDSSLEVLYRKKNRARLNLVLPTETPTFHILNDIDILKIYVKICLIVINNDSL